MQSKIICPILHFAFCILHLTLAVPAISAELFLRDSDSFDDAVEGLEVEGCEIELLAEALAECFSSFGGAV